MIYFYKNIKLGRKFNIPLSLVLISLLPLTFSGCIDEAFSESDFNAETKNDINLKIGLNLSLPTSLVTRSSTEPDGSSDYEHQFDENEGILDTFDGFEKENIIYPLYLHFFSVEDNDEGNPGEKVETHLFTINYREIIDFNKSNLQSQSVNLDVSPYDIAQIAEKPLIRIYASGNMYYGDFLNTGNWFVENSNNKYFSNEDYKFDANTAHYFISETSNEELSFLPDFPSKKITNDPISYNGGTNIPVFNDQMFEINCGELKKADIDEYISKMNTSADISQLKDNINNTIKDCFAGKELVFQRLLARVDFRDKTGPYDSNTELKYQRLYSLKKDDPNCKLMVKLSAMTPINISRYTYLFRHTAVGDDIQAMSDPQLFGIENNNDCSSNDYNWIADLDWDYKSQMVQYWNDSEIEKYFFNIPGKEISMNDPNSSKNNADPFVGKIGQGLAYNTGFKAIRIDDLVSDNNYSYQAELLVDSY